VAVVERTGRGKVAKMNISDLEEEVNKLNTALREKLEKEAADAPKVLYQYTNIKVLKSIIENQELWATHIKFLNDKKELNHGLDIARNIIKEMKPSYESSGSEYAMSFLKSIEKEKCFEKFLDDIDLYIICFSEKGDLLSQWRGYGDGYNSVSIGFNTKNFMLNNNYQPHIMRFLHKVEYNENQQKQKMKEYISDMCKILSKAKDIDINDIRFIKLLKIQIFPLLRLASTMKDSSWSEEAEWRLIIIPEICNPIGGEFVRNIQPEFRTKNNYDVPYIKDNPFGDPFLNDDSFRKEGIKKIILPQSDNFDRAKKYVELLLKNKEFYSVEIEQSKIPIEYQTT
jgi:hypothetical protein